MGFEQSGMELILRDSFSAVGRRYAQAVGQINRVDEQSAKVAVLAARARQSYAKTISETTRTVKAAADAQRKALRSILDESKTIQTAIDPSKWVKSADAAKKTLGDLIPAGVRDRLDGFSKGIGNIVGKMGSLPGSVQAATGSLGNFSTMLGGTVGKMNLAITAATALTVVFIGLGMRGAAMRGVVEAFDVSADRAGVLANVLLGDLRNASRGTIADMELMRTANVALAGASEEVSIALGREGGLAGLMEIARAQARATGNDVGFFFNSLVTGVKRSSRQLIDDTGLVISLGEANKAYAESLGKTVDQLTAQEKQIALLNATLAAGQVAVEAYGNRSLTAAERMARINTTITNTLDRLSLAIQPAYELLLAIGETLLNVLVYPIRDVFLPIFGEFVAVMFGPLLQAWEGMASGLNDLLAPALQTIHRWVVLVVSVFRAYGMAMSWLVKTAGQVLKPFKDIIKKYVVEPIAKYLDPAAFAQRAGNIFGAFAGGILWAANTMIFPAVIQIAEVIASLLMGSSPPPAGPLATIDRGAANVMQAWLAGFTGVPLTPVADMAAAVNAELGAIGTLTNTQARAMLAQLDAQLQPFIDNLTIAKAKMEAIVTPLKEAADILQKRVTKNVKAFFAGDLSAEELRALDAQNQAVNDRLSAFQDMSDEAQLQLAMMKAQQAVQRALLGIQIARTQEAEATTSATAGGDGSAARSRAGGGGGAADETAAAGGGSGLPTIDADPVGDFLGVTDEEVNQLWGDITTGFADSLTENPLFSAQWTQAEANVGRLGDALGKIKDSDAFGGITSAVDKVFGTGEDSIRTKIGNFVSDVEKWFTGDLPDYFGGVSLDSFASSVGDGVSKANDFLIGSGQGSLQSTLIELPENVYNWLSGVGDKIDEALVKPVQNKVRDVLFSLIGGGGRDAATSLKSVMEQVPTSLPTWLVSLPTALLNALSTPFGTAVQDILLHLIGGGGRDTEMSLKSLIEGLPLRITTWLETLPDTLAEFLYAPFNVSLLDIFRRFSDIFGITEGGSLMTLFNTFIVTVAELFANTAGSPFYDAFATVGDMFKALVLSPIQRVVNSVITIVVEAYNALFRMIDDSLGVAGDLLHLAGISVASLGELHADNYKINLADLIGAATGGAFSAGLLRVHKGEVVAAASSPMAVFPARWVTAMETIARNTAQQTYRPLPTAQPVIVPVNGGQNGMNINQNFYGPADNNSVRRGWYELQALGAMRS